MSGGLFLLGSVSQFAHKTALGVAAVCGNGTCAPSDIADAHIFPELEPSSQLLSAEAVEQLEVSAAVSPKEPMQKDRREIPRAKLANGNMSLSGGYIFYDGAEQISPNGAQGSANAGIAASATALMAQPGLVDLPGATPVTTEPGTYTQRDADKEPDEALSKYPEIMQQALLSRGGLTLAGGYSSVEGPNASVKIARSNMGGRNRELSASARYSKIQALFEVGYADGNFLGSSTAFAPTLFANRLIAKGFGDGFGTTPFKQTARGINVHFNRKFESGFAVTANYRLSGDSFGLRRDGAICDSSLFGSPICNALGKTTSSVLSFALTLDKRDNAASPTRGFKLRLTQDLAGLGGTARYSRTRVGGSAHIGLGGDWNLSLGAEGGFLAPFGRKEAPLFERFYIGGTSMRGFDLRGIGPKVRPSAAGPDRNVAIGGRAYYAARAELAVPLGGMFDNYGVQPSFFIDAGSVFGAGKSSLLTGETLIGNSARPRVAVGLGLSLNTPAGKLRLDFAQPVLRQTGDRSKMMSISFGAAM